MKRSSTSSTERIGISSVQKLFEEIKYIFREQPISDYGIDAHIEIVQSETVTGQLIAAQIKSGASWFDEKTDTDVIFRSDKAHLDYWLNHALPVIVILYDPDTDLAYWELVDEEKVELTQKGWKLKIPFAQKIDASSKSLFEQIIGKPTPKDEYTILSLQDSSHNGAKRYSANILVPSTSQSAIRKISEKAIKEIRQRQYYRSEITKKRWENTPAHVVFLFVYTSIDDFRMTNWISRSLWIDNTLPEQFAPLRFKGELNGDDIISEWSPHYNILRLTSQQNTLTKEEYLDAMQSHLNVMSPLLSKAEELTRGYEAKVLSNSDYLSQMIALQPQVNRCYISFTNVGLAPLECKDVSQRFRGAMAYADNVLLPFSENGLTTWNEQNRNYLVRQALEDYAKEMVRLEFELEKIQ